MKTHSRFRGDTGKNAKILNTYRELRTKMEEVEKLYTELLEHPEFDDEMAAGPGFKELREAAQSRRAKVAELERRIAVVPGLNAALHQWGLRFKYVKCTR